MANAFVFVKSRQRNAKGNSYLPPVRLCGIKPVALGCHFGKEESPDLAIILDRIGIPQKDLATLDRALRSKRALVL